jgi:hypothetical protein
MKRSTALGGGGGLVILAGVLLAAQTLAGGVSASHEQHDPETVAAATATPPGSSFTFDGRTALETFDGAPDAPKMWRSANWDVTVHSRDVETWDQLEPMAAMHGPHCEGPPASHEISGYDEAVFQCRDHVMTAINGGGYAAIFLVPAVLMDFTEEEAVLRFDVSTLRMSNRDWWDIWITPFEANVQLAAFDGPDFAGHAREAVHVEMDLANDSFIAQVIRDGTEIELEPSSEASYTDVLTPDAARRDTFELRLSRDHLTFGMPDYGLQWLDTGLDELDWSQGVVQIGHRSYNPLKAHEPPDPQPNTWHWDNVEVSPAVPFTMVHATERTVGGGDAVATVSFDAPAPPDAHLRFAGIGDDLEVSFDGGSSWQAAELQWTSDPGIEDHFHSFWMPVPEGVTEVKFRGADWWGGEWRVRDLSFWSLTSDG